jgi:cysteinylglycine-S-conjugate dipeptidase
VSVSATLDKADATGDVDIDALVQDLAELVSIPSVIDPHDTPPTTKVDVERAGMLAMQKLKAAGLQEIAALAMPNGAPPLIYASHRVTGAPKDTPTVLLYAHYDVVPRGNWADAFTPTRKLVDGRERLFGRGAADDKSGVIMHLGTTRAFGGQFPVHLKVILEGQEEVASTALEAYVKDHPDKFAADVMVIADGGNCALGVPTLTVSLRGFVCADLTVRTLKSTVHSGMYGGPVPDAYYVLTHILASLHDEDGAVAVPGLNQGPWDGLEPPIDQFRADAGLMGVDLLGTGTLGSRLYTKPSITVIGLDGLPGLAQARNALSDQVTARISMRIPPGQDPAKAFACLHDHVMRVNRQWNAKVGIQQVETGVGWRANTAHPAFAAAASALEAAYPGQTTQCAGQGASIPLVGHLQDLNPSAAVLIWGAEEPGAHIHSCPESVDLQELRDMTAAQINLLRCLADSANQ